MVTLLDEAGCERVRKAIEAAELLTAGEIRVLVVGRSAGPDWKLGALAGVVAGSVAYAVLARAAWGHPGTLELAISAAVGLAAFVAAALAASRLWIDRAVRRRAEREFVRLGIARTAGRTGVLIMLSAVEHRAILLADEAIDAKVPPRTWAGVVGRLAAAMRDGRAAEGVAAAVLDVGRLLGAEFPRAADDVNELPDEVAHAE